MSALRQIDFFTPKSGRKLREHARRLDHGGDLCHGRRKLARPFDSNRPAHLVLKSSRARGALSMIYTSRARTIQRLIYRYAGRNEIKIYQFANAGNHLHLLIKAKSRKGFQNFLRTIAALIARLMTGAKKGNAAGKFWDALAWTRVLSGRSDFSRVRNYLILNEMEAAGVQFRKNTKSTSTKKLKNRPSRP